MSNVNPGKEKIKIFETVLSSPGMNEKCKISLQLSRQTILLLSRLIENGLLTENNPTTEFMNLLPKDSVLELENIVPELLKRSGLTEFYANLKSLYI